MLEAAKKGKQVRFEATEDTSYKNINHIKKLGLIEVLEDTEKNYIQDIVKDKFKRFKNVFILVTL